MKISAGTFRGVFYFQKKVVPRSFSKTLRPFTQCFLHCVRGWGVFLFGKLLDKSSFKIYNPKKGDCIMENETVLMIRLVLILTILVEGIILDRAYLEKKRTAVIVKDKRIKCGRMETYEDFIIDFELYGKKYSAFVSSKFYETIERGAIVCLEYGKSRLIRSMVFKVLEN